MNLVGVLKPSKLDIATNYVKNTQILKIEVFNVPADTTLLKCFKMLKKDKFLMFSFKKNNKTYTIDENELLCFLKSNNALTPLADVQKITPFN